MKRLLMFITLLVVVPSLYLHAQRASVEFRAGNATSVVQIAPSALGYNGAVTPIAFNPSYSRTPVFNGFIITSTPIAVSASRSVAIDLRGSTTIIHDDPAATKSVLQTGVEVLDATTGAVLWKEEGFSTFMQSMKLGNDTVTTQHLTINLSTMQAKEVVLRFTGTSILTHNAPPLIAINNGLSTNIDQVH